MIATVAPIATGRILGEDVGWGIVDEKGVEIGVCVFVVVEIT